MSNSDSLSPPTNRQNLPPEILNQILGLLPSRSAYLHMLEGVKEALVACSHVCRRWRSVAVPLIWSELVIYYDPADNELLRKFSQFLVAARFASVAGQYDYASFVKTLILTDTFYHGQLSFADITKPMISIAQLFSNTQLQSMLFRFPDKCERGCCNIYPLVVAMERLVAGLKQLELHHVNEYAKASRLLEFVPPPPTLEKLYIEGTFKDNFKPDGSICLNRVFLLPNLCDLALNHLNSTVTPTQLVQGLCLWGLRFRRLSLIGCPSLIDDKVILALVEHCPNLVSLELGYPFDDTDRKRPILDSISDRSMSRLIAQCTRLRELYCGDIASLTDTFLAYCAAHGYALRKLTILSFVIVGCGVTDLSGWGQLEELEIADTNTSGKLAISEAFQRAVLEECHSLKECRLGNEWIVGP
ncbi:hypothetical protein BC937DRAFT_94964 [Endogone sp. FLAS-F59071]|nr:hypothetical protein BC937DRAFT_94964 [Endogone sp. FLAS-F59071]|eukprot:RUS13667.1 hypothetical protein BC937DRAFT_94964 [Endogone sp. FLAS-F59071]